MNDSDRRAVAAWLYLCAALVFAMVVVGGVTRLTHSGLSIVEWQPFIGTVPPLSEADWQAQFAKYRETPEFKQVNHGMDLAGFKGIFWWEYAHRLLGRVIGLVFLLPYLWFLARRRLDRARAWQLAGIFALGGLQGFVGWYMVSSGLVDDPRVSHFRLTLHLGLALAIFAAELWVAMSLTRRAGTAAGAPRGLALAFAALVYLQSLAGGFVAGLRAGKAYNTFPLMNGHLVPPELFMLEPWWRNFAYNMATVQFVHRGLAWLLLALAPVLLARAWHTPGLRVPAIHLAVFVLAQFTLGVATLLHAVPVGLGAAHQGMAVLVLGAALWTAHGAVWTAHGAVWTAHGAVWTAHSARGR